MAISGVEANSALGNSGQADSLSKLADDFDQFLTILTTQLRNQDPLSPMETNEFTTQLVQFSLVEQQIKTNTLLEAQLSNQELDKALAASSFIGKDVELATDTAQLIGGQATWVYDLQSESVLTNVKIVDANTGLEVLSFPGNTIPGVHEVVWDGTLPGGGTAPDGFYRIEVAAVDDQGAPIGAFLRGFNRVQTVDYTGTEPVLLINGQKLPISRVTRISG